MKRYLLLLSSILLLILSSCKKDDGVSFGTVEYYPSFLWVDSKITPVTKTFEFDFSQDAKDNHSFAVFQFVTNDGKPISTDVMQVIIDNNEIANNCFQVNCNDTSKELIFKFSPSASSGKYQGYLKLVNHALDRLDSQPLTPGQQVDVFQWTLNYDRGMNPLAIVLLCIGVVILVLLLVWFAFLRRVFFPTIKVGKIRITEPYYSERTIKGARRVVLTNKATKQSLLNRLFTGPIINEVHSSWSSPIVLESSKRQVKIRPSTSYTLDPPAFILTKQTEYTIKHNDGLDVKHVLTVY